MPGLWWPDSGGIERPAVFEAGDGRVRLPLSLGPNASVFVVFRPGKLRFDPVLAVIRNGQSVFPTPATPRKIAIENIRVRRDVSGNISLEASEPGCYELMSAAGRVAGSGEGARVSNG